MDLGEDGGGVGGCRNPTLSMDLFVPISYLANCEVRLTILQTLLRCLCTVSRCLAQNVYCVVCMPWAKISGIQRTVYALLQVLFLVLQ